MKTVNLRPHLKRNILIAAVLLLVCAAAFLNWSYNQRWGDGNSAMADELENTISIYSAQRGQVIVSALQPVREIKVFNVSGALVRQFSVNTTQYTFPIQSGLYIIYASDGEQEHTEKVIVR